MEINMNKFHVEEAVIRYIYVSKNTIHYYFEFNNREQCYTVTNNEFNRPLALAGIMFRNLYKGINRVWLLIYARKVIAVAPTITALAKKDFYTIDTNRATVKLTEAWLEVQNDK